MSVSQNVLVVDGQRGIRSTIETMLNQLQHTVHLAKSGKQALHIMGRRSDIDLVLCDLHMEKMSGLDVIGACSEISPNLPVILMSAQSRDASLGESLRLGAVDYLMKPFGIAELEQVIARIDQTTAEAAQRLQNIGPESNLEMSFHSTSRQLSVRRLQAVVKYSLQLYTRMPEDDLLNISLALEEAVLNAHEHGNLELDSVWKEEYVHDFETTLFDAIRKERLDHAEYADRILDVHLKLRPDSVTVTVEDGGKGYLAGVVRGNTELKPHGMGLIIITHLMDAVHFDKGGASITFNKKIS